MKATCPIIEKGTMHENIPKDYLNQPRGTGPRVSIGIKVFGLMNISKCYANIHGLYFIYRVIWFH